MTQINALIVYVTSARPGCLSFFQSLEKITKSLMFGQISSDLIAALQDGKFGLLGRMTLNDANDQDEKSLSIQNTSCGWEDVEMESIALQKASFFF